MEILDRYSTYEKTICIYPEEYAAMKRGDVTVLTTSGAPGKRTFKSKSAFYYMLGSARKFKKYYVVELPPKRK